MDTRIITGNRLELVSRRIEFLAGEINNLTNERVAYEAEQELLKGLQKHYRNIGDDPIDTERESNFSLPSGGQVLPASTKRKSPAGANQNIVLSLLDSGPATLKDLAAAAELTHRQVGNTCYLLVKAGLVERLGWGQYRKTKPRNSGLARSVNKSDFEQLDRFKPNEE